MAMLDFYIEPYLGYASTDQVCLCALAERSWRCHELRARVGRFFRAHQVWLTTILKRASRRKFKLRPGGQVARLVFRGLQSARWWRTTGAVPVAGCRNGAETSSPPIT